MFMVLDEATVSSVLITPGSVQSPYELMYLMIVVDAGDLLATLVPSCVLKNIELSSQLLESRS